MLNQAKHRTILLQILKELYSNSKTSTRLGFKGGTALYLLYDLNRFSVDLDFDLLESESEQEIEQSLESTLKNFGQIKSLINKRNSIQAILSYSSDSQKIKIDISKRDFGSSYELKNLYGLSLNVMVKEDLFANKLVAASERQSFAIRDIYDIHFMLKNLWT